MNYRQKLNELKALRDHKKNEISLLEGGQNELNDAIIHIEKARGLILTAAEATQENVKGHLTSIVSLALKTVLPNPPEFKAEIVTRRNQTEVDFILEKNGNQFPIMDSSGGGLLDLISFSLRISLWMLKNTRKIFVLDEPFRNVSHIYQDKVGELLSILSKKLDIQFLIVSHQKNVDQYADKKFCCLMQNSISNLMEN